MTPLFKYLHSETHQQLPLAERWQGRGWMQAGPRTPWGRGNEQLCFTLVSWLKNSFKSWTCWAAVATRRLIPKHWLKTSLRDTPVRTEIYSLKLTERAIMLAKPLSTSQDPWEGDGRNHPTVSSKFCLTYFIAWYIFQSLGANNCWKNLIPAQYIRHYNTNLHP